MGKNKSSAVSMSDFAKAVEKHRASASQVVNGNQVGHSSGTLNGDVVMGSDDRKKNKKK